MKFNTIIIGAGAAGLMCAWQAGKRGQSVCIIEHTGKIGEKIRISGGGRSNFTNLYCSPDNFLSQNPHFCKSALARFTPYDFLAIMDDHHIPYHEKPYEEKTGNENARGQMFCDNSAGDLIDMLKNRCAEHGVEIALKTKVTGTSKTNKGFLIKTDQGDFECKNLVIASGGLSIPKIGASNFGYELAKQYGLSVIPPRAALVPLTFDDELLSKTRPLSGVSLDAKVSCNGKSFREGLLFTHRGLSGPSILQISSYWNEGDSIEVNMSPDQDMQEHLENARDASPKKMIQTVLEYIIPSRISVLFKDIADIEKRIGDTNNKTMRDVSDVANMWKITPNGSEGFRTAEVTLGGVDTNCVSSKTFEARDVKGLYFIGEVLDITGHLGGHNFQWAWASAHACAQALD
ncbi:MAG: NAD(P)/FAD-dependent oxidoreductase [Alphaproteobacteria bacterium]